MNAVVMNPCATPELASDAPNETRLSAAEEISFDGIWRDGNLLVLTKGVELPNICLQSNEPTDEARIEQQCTWTPRWLLAVVGLIFLLNIPFAVFLCFILTPFFTQRPKVHYPASPKLYRRSQWSQRIGWATGAATVVLFLGIVVGATQIQGPIEYFLLLGGLVFGIPVVIFIGSSAKNGVGWQPLQVNRISKRHVWLKGVHPDYLKRLPELPNKVVTDPATDARSHRRYAFFRTFGKVAFSCILVLIAVGLRLDWEVHFDPIQSPDGTLLQPYLDKSGCVSFSIDLGIGNTIARINTGASNDSKWALGWLTNDTIVFDGKDIGTCAWQLGEFGKLTTLYPPFSNEILLRCDELMRLKYESPRRH